MNALPIQIQFNSLLMVGAARVDSLLFPSFIKALLWTKYNFCLFSSLLNIISTDTI
jgi:hypothetical protein